MDITMVNPIDHVRTRRNRSPSLPCRPVALVPTARFCGALVEVGRAGCGEEDDLLSQNPAENTARTDRIVGNTVICRTFVRSVSPTFVTRAGGPFARISQIAIAHRTRTIGALTVALSVFCSALPAEKS
jgi:hypothetical protein